MSYFVYILASKPNGTLYIGFTGNLAQRVLQHKHKSIHGFTKKYGVDKLVWFDVYESRDVAMIREKQLKKWNRDWKIRLIQRTNPEWKDLYNNF